MEDILLVHRKTKHIFPQDPQQTAVWKTCLRQILFCQEADVDTIGDSLRSDDQILRGVSALKFLLEVLCGLHSPIIGETEVFGQFKNFIESRKAQQDGLFGDHQKWLQFVLTEVKRTRAEHLVGIGSQSYGSLIRRYTKDYDSVSLCGSGQLAQEILPWIAHKSHLQMICRNPNKMEAIAAKYANLSLSTYQSGYVHGEVLVIAAPLSDDRILDLLHRQETRPHAICDLRGEDNTLSTCLTEQFPHITYVSLQKFFAEIEETKKETHAKIECLKALLLERAQTFAQRVELRPLGWDDLCA